MLFIEKRNVVQGIPILNTFYFINGYIDIKKYIVSNKVQKLITRI